MSLWRDVLFISLGAALGANLRFAVNRLALKYLSPALPYGTLIVNVTGSFILGVIMGLLDAHVLAPAVRLSLGIGFVGAYTTFSTFTYETLRLVESGSVLLAATNVVGSVIVGMLAAIAGLAAGRAL